MTAVQTLWHSFSRPANVEEAINSNEERVVLVLRAHPITIFPWALLSLVMLMIPLLFAQYLSYLNLSPNQELFIIALWYAFVFGYILTKIYFWYFNLGVVTNHKIVDVDANNLLNTVTSVTAIDKIEEVNKKSLGIISGLFDFGDIYVETAGNIPNIEFHKVPKPSEVVSIIHSNMQKHGRKHPH